jgi:hypothetical protein
MCLVALAVYACIPNQNIFVSSGHSGQAIGHASTISIRTGDQQMLGILSRIFKGVSRIPRRQTMAQRLSVEIALPFLEGEEAATTNPESVQAQGEDLHGLRSGH